MYTRLENKEITHTTNSSTKKKLIYLQIPITFKHLFSCSEGYVLNKSGKDKKKKLNQNSKREM